MLTIVWTGDYENRTRSFGRRSTSVESCWVRSVRFRRCGLDYAQLVNSRPNPAHSNSSSLKDVLEATYLAAERRCKQKTEIAQIGGYANRSPPSSAVFRARKTVENISEAISQ